MVVPVDLFSRYDESNTQLSGYCITSEYSFLLKYYAASVKLCYTNAVKKCQ